MISRPRGTIDALFRRDVIPIRVCFVAALLTGLLGGCRGSVTSVDETVLLEPTALSFQIVAGPATVDQIVGDRQVITIPLQLREGFGDSLRQVEVNGAVITGVRGTPDAPIQPSRPLPLPDVKLADLPSNPPRTHWRTLQDSLTMQLIIDPPKRDRLEHVEGFVSFYGCPIRVVVVPGHRPRLGRKLVNGLWLERLTIDRPDDGPITDVAVRVRRSESGEPADVFDGPIVVMMKVVEQDASYSPMLGRVAWTRSERDAERGLYNVSGRFRVQTGIEQICLFVLEKEREFRVPFTLTDVPLTH